MSVLCEYFPVRIAVRLGQQSGSTTNPFVNVVPLSISCDCTVGIDSSSKRWSSVRINTMFGWTRKSCVDTTEPAGFVTVTGPVVAVSGTTAVSSWFDTTWKDADTPLKRTDRVAVKRVPWIVTVMPVGPTPGENDVIVGGRLAATISGSEARSANPSVAARTR